MRGKNREFSAEFKARVAVEAIKGEVTLNELTRKYGVHGRQVNRWKQQGLSAISGIFTNKGSKGNNSDQKLIEQLYQQIGQMKYELDFLKKSVWDEK